MELTHYASPYYDPVKAHEYYEAHKKLKGRRPTAGLSEEGRIAANYVKKSINEERKKISDQSRASLNRNLEKISNERRNAIERDRERTKAEIKAHSRKVQTESAHLRILIESGALKDDPEKRYEVLSKIKSLREETNKKLKELQSRFQKNSEDTRLNAYNRSESLRKEHQSNLDKIKEAYDNQYDYEIEQLMREYGKSSGLSKPSTRNKSSSSSGLSKLSTKNKSSSSSEYITPKKEQTSKWAMRKKERLKNESEARSKSKTSSERYRTQMYHYDLYLMHHGIKGQRWGIRRYQNEDGSLTDDGKKRYGYSGEGTKKSSSPAKKVAIGAAIVAGTALAAYGSYKLYNISKEKKVKSLGIEALKQMGIDVFEPDRIKIDRVEPERISVPKAEVKKPYSSPLTLNSQPGSVGEDYLSKILKNSQGLSEVIKKNEEFKQTFGDLDELTKSLLKNH